MASLRGLPVRRPERPGELLCHPNGDSTREGPHARFQERHYSVREVGEMWGFSPDVVRELFKREPGVLVLGNDGGRGKRGYHTLRIPESVVERVHRRLCNL